MIKNKNKKIWSILLAITMINSQSSAFAMAAEWTDAVTISENSAAESTLALADEENVAAVTAEDMDAENAQAEDAAVNIDESEVETQENVTESSTSELTEDEIQILSESEILAASEEEEQILGDVDDQKDTEDLAAMLISNGSEESESKHLHCVCGKANATEETHTHDSETTWQALSGTISGTLKSGNYYLSEDVAVASGTLTIAGTVNLCLNGHTLTGAAASEDADGVAVITVPYGKKLSITDCQGSGKITGGSASGIVNSGKLVLWNGSITGNTAEYEGGGVYTCSQLFQENGEALQRTASFTMYDGKITGNSATVGGGVSNGGNFTMYGGTITQNEAEDGGGVFNYTPTITLDDKTYQGKCSFIMHDGSITKNSAETGGGIRNDNTFTMYGGSITYNTAYEGGGIYNCGVEGIGDDQYRSKGSSISMCGGNITGNIAEAGGGVFNDCGTVILYDGSIASNSAEDGGGIYNHCTRSNLGGTLKMQGGTITGNSASYQGGGVSNFFTFTMSGGSIANNTVYSKKGLTVSANSGGVLNAATLTLSGSVVITGNTLGGKTNNVCLYNYCEGDMLTHSYEITPTITAQELAEDARIGVNAFTPVSSLTLVTGSTDTTIFTSDDYNYILVNDGSNGVKLANDTTAPMISGGINGKSYCSAVILTITDEHLNKVTVNGTEVTLADSKVTIGSAAGAQTVTATDMVGNSASLTITVNANHTWNDGKITKEPTCTAAGVRLYTCKICGATKTGAVSATGHKYGSWTTTSKATVFSPAIQTRTCSVCKNKETCKTESKLTPTIQVNATTVLLKVKQKTSAFKVTGLANGDSVASYKSGNTKIFTVDSKKGIITAGKKAGSAKLTITLKSGTTKTVTVKVQKKVVKTTKITGLQTKVVLKKGAKVKLTPSRTPITSIQKFTYKSSNKKVAAVNSSGMITAKKKGTVKITVKSGSVTKKVTVIVK